MPLLSIVVTFSGTVQEGATSIVIICLFSCLLTDFNTFKIQLDIVKIVIVEFEEYIESKNDYGYSFILLSRAHATRTRVKSFELQRKNY